MYASVYIDVLWEAKRFQPQCASQEIVLKRLLLDLLFSTLPDFVTFGPDILDAAIGALGFCTMSDYRGQILTSNVLAFGIAAFSVVSLRLGFRLYTKKTSSSDWILLVGLVSRSVTARICNLRMSAVGADDSDAVAFIARAGCFERSL